MAKALKRKPIYSEDIFAAIDTVTLLYDLRNGNRKLMSTNPSEVSKNFNDLEGFLSLSDDVFVSVVDKWSGKSYMYYYKKDRTSAVRQSSGNWAMNVVYRKVNT